ncbi:MAG: PAS domain S-box protein [Terracidiphilus sp.]|jgi:diguanylate cyclase (GGDEF)-like protein/PAS domain S-box-containing protein
MRIEAEANLSALIESTEDLIWSVDLDDRLVTFNGALQNHLVESFGNRPVVGMFLKDFVSPLLPSLYRRARVEGSFRCELPLTDGRVLELSFNPIFVDGIMIGVSVFGRDITEAKKAESALREAEQKYRDIFDGAVEGFYQTTLDGRSLTANPALAKMLGYDSPDDFVSSVKCTAREAWVDAGERARMMQQLEEHGSVRGYHCRFKRKDGSTIWASLNVRRVSRTIEREPYLEGFIEDITERKQAEEALRANGDFLMEAERFGNLGSYVLDFHSGRWSSTAKLDELFGIDNQYIRSVQGWADLVHPEERAQMSAYFEEEVVGKRKDFDREYRIVRRSDETERWVHGTGRLEFDAEDKPLKMRGLIRDITEHKRAELAMQDSEERYRAVFQTSPDALMISRMSDGTVLDVNQSFLDSAGFERHEVIGRTTSELGIWVNESDRQMLISLLQRNSRCRDLEVMSRRKNGELFWMRLSASLIEIGGEQCRLTFARDISAAKAADEALRLSEQRYRTAFQTSIDSININRLSDGKYIDCNQAFLDMTGFEREEVLGKTSLELGIWADSRDRQAMAEMVRQNLSCKRLEAQFKKKNGELMWGQMSASEIDVNGVPCVLSITRDLSKSKAAENEIRSLAFYDPLTGLPNRRLLLDRLHQSLDSGMQSNSSRALLFVELDNLKTLNETLGHQTGDLLIQEVARRIAACVKDGDTVGRLGGDEFVALLEDLGELAEEAAAGAKAVGEKIMASISQAYLIDGRECLSTASIGITVFRDHRKSTDELMQQADVALYEAKAAGRNTMRFFSHALQTSVNARATLEEDLYQAIKKKQFILYYQPQLTRGRLAGAEVLIRWQHPTRGSVPPEEFIPLAEETGLILPLGDWILETACMQIAAWAGSEKASRIMISVNISALQFRQPRFVERVLLAMDRTGANPRNLKIELTESMLVENIDDVVAKMTELKSHGLSFSLDDFGTGYSSLAYLKRLPLDQLKIDRAFVRDMLVDVTSGAIAQAIISLGTAMGLSVIAEGVETEEQRGFLAGLGCHAFQGTLFSPPLPLQEFEALL